jgi:hypothetical protein
MTRLSCPRFRSNQVRLAEPAVVYDLGNLWRRPVLPGGIENWPLTSLLQRLVEDRRMAGKTCALLLVIAAGRTSVAAAVRGDAGPDRANAGTDGIDRQWWSG